MLLDQFQIDQTRARFAANAARRAVNERLIAQGRLLQVDTPERVNKFLARRGLHVGASGAEMTANVLADAAELGARPGEALERILGSSDLMGIAFLETGLQVARSVGRVWVDVAGGRAYAYGTGFMISPRLLLTNHHVIGDPAVAARSLVEFDYALQANGQALPPAKFAFDPATFHLADRNLDFALVAVRPTSEDGRPVAGFGWNRLVKEEGKAIAAQFANIIQHPNGEMKQLTLRENRIVQAIPQFLHYTADTLGGSSGSPVYNDRWEVVALHHSGIWATNADGQALSRDNTVWRPEMGDDKIQWLYNEGARVSSLVTYFEQQTLDAAQTALLREALDGAPFVAAQSAARPETRNAAGGVEGGGFMPAPQIAAGIAGGIAGGIATWTIPLQVSVAIGGAQAPATAPLAPIASPPPRNDGLPTPQIDRTGDVVAAARDAFKRPDVLGVRSGFVFADGEITKQRAIVVTVRDKRPLSKLSEAGIAPLPAMFRGLPVEIVGPTTRDLVAQSSGPMAHEIFDALRSIAEEITYVPPDGVTLAQVTAKMRILAHVSPDAGWPTLRGFIDATRARLVVGMYDFGAPHIVTAIEQMGGKPGFKKMTLTMRPHGSLDKPGSKGPKKDDLDNAVAAEQIGDALGAKFECAFVKIGSVNGWVARAYHIKVAVRDEKAFWLSSGNWQSSNQGNIDPLHDRPQTIAPLRIYNREWHIVAEHAGLAKTLQAFLLNDFKHNPLSTEEAALPALPDLFIPVTAPGFGREAAPQFKYFPPFDATRDFTVTPLLTPHDFVQPVRALIEEAESEILVQNQTFNAPTEGQDDLASLIDAIIDKQRQGVAVRVIIRSFFPADDRANLEALTERGLKPGTVRFQENSHTKGVIVDRKKVLVGSQNWSQLGVTLNRDASLLFDDAELANYFAEIFEHDWTVLARSKVAPDGRSARIAGASEATPAGFVRVSAADLLDPS